MKKYFLFIAVLLFSVALSAQVDQGKGIANVKIKDLTGKIVNTADFDNGGKPIVISFWATWCKPCLDELTTINELYDTWREETGVKIIAVSIDDTRNSKRVAPFVKARTWEYEVYLDENSDFKRAMGVNNPPHTILLDSNKNIVYEHNGFASGDENHLYDEIKKLVSKSDEKEENK